MRPHYHSRNCGRGGYAAGSPSNTNVISLYNNSTGGSLLVLRALEVFSSGAGLVAFTALQGSLGTLRQAGAPLVTNDAAPWGQVFSIDTASPPAADFYVENALNGYGSWTHEYPLAVLQPGWSAAISSNGTGTSLTVGFLWQVVKPEELADYFY